MRISDWSSDVCSSDLIRVAFLVQDGEQEHVALDGIFADCYRRWGGRFSLIGPCERHKVPDVYWPWLASYDPDVVYSYFHMDDGAVLQLHDRHSLSVDEALSIMDRHRFDAHTYRPDDGGERLANL